MDNLIEHLFNGRRAMEKALADLLADYQRNPRPALAQTIELLRAEIELRERPELAFQGSAVEYRPETELM